MRDLPLARSQDRGAFAWHPDPAGDAAVLARAARGLHGSLHPLGGAAARGGGADLHVVGSPLPRRAHQDRIACSTSAVNYASGGAQMRPTRVIVRIPPGSAGAQMTPLGAFPLGFTDQNWPGIHQHLARTRSIWARSGLIIQTERRKREQLFYRPTSCTAYLFSPSGRTTR